MDYRLLIARRYLLSSRKVSLISIITGISIAGITVGVAALVVVLSVMNGFFELVRDMLISFDPHVRIVSVEGGFRDADSLITAVNQAPHVVSATAYVEGKALLTHNSSSDINKVVVVRGIDLATQDEVNGLSERITYGTFDLERRQRRPGIVVGAALADRLGLFPGSDLKSTSTLSLLSTAGIERMLTQVVGFPPFTLFEVRGLYSMESVYDENYVFVSLKEAQRLFRLRDRVTGIELRLDDLEQAASVKETLQQQLPAAQFEVLTWYDIQKTLYDVMRLEKWGASLILILVIVVAAFNIVGALTMIVIEKRRDLAVLQAMGVSRNNIHRIFMTEGVLIATLGSLIGLGLGLGLVYLQHQLELISIVGSDAFIIDAYPVSVQVGDLLVIVGAVFALCLLAAAYPAWRASSIAPAQAVRNE